MKILISLFLVLYSLGSFAIESDKEANNKLSVSASGTHSDGFRDDIDSTSSFSVSGSYKISEKVSISAFQSLRKYYYYDEYRGQEFVWSDFRLGASYALDSFEKYLDAVSFGISYDLPSSRKSSDKELNGRVRARFSITKSFFDKKLSVTYTPYGTWNLNQNKQTLEGSVNTQFVLGNSLSLSYAVSEKLSLSASAGFGQSYEEKGDFQSQGRNSGGGFVDLGANLSWMVSKSWSLTAGYAHGESQEKGGAIEFYAFDPGVSSWYLSTGYSFF